MKKVFATAVASACVSLSAGAGQLAIPATDQVVIQFKESSRSHKVLDDQDLSSLKDQFRLAGLAMRFLRTSSTGPHVLKLDGFTATPALRGVLESLVKSRADIAFIEPDNLVVPADNDFYYSAQWSLSGYPEGIDLAPSRQYSTGTGVTIAIVDSGIVAHADLNANLVAGYDFVTSTGNQNHDGDGRDSNASDPGTWRFAGQCPAPLTDAGNSGWHGTRVAGIAAAVANNSIGVAGVAPGAKILPVRVLGTCNGYDSDITDGVIWASGGTVSGIPANPNPARVINMSLSGGGSCPSIHQQAVASARSRGAVVIASAGNDGLDASTRYPANCTNVVPVAATNNYGGRAWFSNYGAIVPLAAPGVNILSTTNTGTTTPVGDDYGSGDGTSFAAPIVSGVAALMLSANNSLTPDDVAIILKGTTRPFPQSCSGCGTGIVSATNAVNAVRPGAVKGTLSQTYVTRGSNTSTLVLTNTGSGWITGITASCSQYGAQITSAPPSALGPGVSMTIQARTSPSSYTCGWAVSGNNATNSPYQNSAF